jgi:hypothetical protein
LTHLIGSWGILEDYIGRLRNSSCRTTKRVPLNSVRRDANSHTNEPTLPAGAYNDISKNVSYMFIGLVMLAWAGTLSPNAGVADPNADDDDVSDLRCDACSHFHHCNPMLSQAQYTMIPTLAPGSMMPR